jgi:hypothetical protein
VARRGEGGARRVKRTWSTHCLIDGWPVGGTRALGCFRASRDVGLEHWTAMAAGDWGGAGLPADRYFVR